MDEDDIIKEKQIKIDELSISEIEELIKEYKRKIVDLENKISDLSILLKTYKVKIDFFQKELTW